MNKNLLFVALVALGLVGAMATSADAAVRFCFKHNVDFIDSGQVLTPSCTSFSPDQCEDSWQTNSAYAVRGVRVTVEKWDGSAYVPVWLGSSGWYTDDGNGSDGAGCTPALDPPGSNTGTYKFTLRSSARVNGNYIYSRNTSDELASVVLYKSVTTDGLTYTYSFTPSSASLIMERFNVLSAATQALWEVSFGMGLKYYYFRLDPSSSNRYDRGNHRVMIDADGEGPKRKFIIDHELGHAVLDDILGAEYINDCTFTDPGGVCWSAANEHGVTTKERQSCAMNEGFAHFYASAAFNNDTLNADCYMHHWSATRGTIDCAEDGGTQSYSKAYMQNICNGTAMPGRGVELDWWRAYWDLRTSSWLVSLPAMHDWLQDGSTRAVWGHDDVYEALNDEAVSIGGSFNTQWQAAANNTSGNGLEHPTP